MLTGILLHFSCVPAPAEWFDDAPPAWEPLLWGGKIQVTEESDGKSMSLHPPGGDQPASGTHPPAASRPAQLVRDFSPVHMAGLRPPTLTRLRAKFPRIFSRDPYRRLSLNNIAPLYLSPRLEGEGVWEWKDMPAGDNGWPVIYKTTYRPSRDHPNAVVHMLLFDMKGVSMSLYMGSSEPGAPKGASKIEEEDKSRLLAITNALWKQKHSGGAGTIFRGQVIKEMVPGMATVVIYHDGSVDLVEWNDGIPLRLIRDARQLKHLIVKDGRVVNSVIKHGQRVDSEIGLGFLLSENPEQGYPYGGGYYGYWGGYYRGRPQVNYSDEWYIATRSAFGIRRDGNLVFAIGHHISTKDLARALVLAGCVRAIHGDANPHNVVGNLYYPAEDGSIIKKAKLSPDQKNYTLNRYVNRSYTSDFFGFFRRPTGKEAS